jgi:hypothetical protein
MKKIMYLLVFLVALVLAVNYVWRTTLFQPPAAPEIIVQSATGTTLESTETWLQEKIVSGYQYIYIFKDMGVKITTPALYEPYFYEVPKENIFKRKADMIYLAKNSDVHYPEYIKMFSKDSHASLRDIIEKNYLWSWCKVENRFDDASYNSDKDTWFKDRRPNIDRKNFFDIAPLDTAEDCHADTDFPESYMSIIFLQHPADASRYYKISFGDACAPWPCTIFGSIAFF